MTATDETGFTSLFNGRDLDGWFPTPRIYSSMWEGGPSIEGAYPGMFSSEFLAETPRKAAVWSVEDGAIVGRQNEPGGGYGGFLVSERTYADFELRLEAKPDWPADTGVFVRKNRDTWRGIQILVDHRQSGSIGGYYGNGIGGFHAISFNLSGEVDESGSLKRLTEEDPATSLEPIGNKAALLTYGASGDQFLDAWHLNGWNDLAIRVEGRLPRITTWINDVKISVIDLATLDAPNYDAELTAHVLGRAGHIALEVHETDPILGEARWGRDSACRWRNIRIREIAES